jgi:hypothetical protein
MFAYNTAIFLRQGYKEFYCPLRDFYVQKITSLKDQDPSLPGSTTPSFPLHRSHRDQQ